MQLLILIVCIVSYPLSAYTTLFLHGRLITPQATGTRQPRQRPTPTPIATGRTPDRTSHQARHPLHAFVITPPRPVIVHLGVTATVCSVAAATPERRPHLHHPLDRGRFRSERLGTSSLTGSWGQVMWNGHTRRSGHPGCADWKHDCCGMDPVVYVLIRLTCKLPIPRDVGGELTIYRTGRWHFLPLGLVRPRNRVSLIGLSIGGGGG